MELYRLLPRSDATYLVAPPARERVQRMRVCFQYADEQYLYVTPLDEVSEKPYLVRYNIPQINEEFAEDVQTALGVMPRSIYWMLQWMRRES